MKRFGSVSEFLLFSLLATSVVCQDDDDDDPDPTDQSYIAKWAAIGDSYAAGIGSGTALDMSGCARYNESYPSMINYYAGNPDRGFQYSACSGATSPEILAQLQDIENNQDIITISSGGNDVDLVGLLNSCIYQWHPFGPSCDDQIEKSWDLINGDDFLNGLTDLASNVTQYLNTGKQDGPVGRAFWTGYAQFFNADTTQCNDVTFSYWDSSDLFGAEKLDQDKRATLNNMTDTVNSKIQQAISNSGERAHMIQFVDINDFVVQNKGRFCEDGVTEPDNDRDLTLFYNTYTFDGTSEQAGELKRDGWPTNSSSVQGQIDTLIQMTSTNSSAGLKVAPKPGDSSVVGDPSNSGDDEYNNDDTISNNGTVVKRDLSKRELSEREGSLKLVFLPRYVTRVFHPRSSLHAAMASLTNYYMADNRASQLNLPREPLYYSISTKIDDGDSQPDPPTTDNTLNCSTGLGDPAPTYSVDFGDSAINWFCSDSRNTQIAASTQWWSQAIYGYQDQEGKSTDVDVVIRMYFHDGDGCKKDPTFIYKPSVDECKSNFGQAMNSCDTDTTSDKRSSYKYFPDKCVAFDLAPCPNTDGSADSACDPNWGVMFDPKWSL